MFPSQLSDLKQWLWINDLKKYSNKIHEQYFQGTTKDAAKQGKTETVKEVGENSDMIFSLTPVFLSEPYYS